MQAGEYLGLSGRNQTDATTIVAGKACRIRGILQLQSDCIREVAKVIAAAGIAPPFHPVLYKEVKRPLVDIVRYG